MRLKSLEIQGYKSFANKVQFLFDEGITAIVGPNGSGKSNTVDAIRWVLGEQSYSSLRGRKTADMIFSGSDGRARLGLAAVTLVLDNTDQWLPLDFAEVTISRRAYRSGENEYYLNNSRVRLKDVGELLSKGGLTRQTYTVIGQGTVDRVLSLQANERRQLFEEAAGIIFHRQKRTEALEKLADTETNLVRLNDLLEDIAPRLGRLEKQAQRAQEYIQLTVRLTELWRIWYGYQWQQAQHQQQQAQAKLQQSESAVAQQQTHLQELAGEITNLRAEQQKLRHYLAEQSSESKQIHQRAEIIARELAVNDERARHYATQKTEVLEDLRQLTTNLELQQQQVVEAQAIYQQIQQELQQATANLQQYEQQLATHQAQHQAILARQTATEKQWQALQTDLTKQQTQLGQLAERRATLLTEQTHGEAEIARWHERQQELQAKRDQFNAELTALEQNLTALETERNNQRDQLVQLQQTAERFKAELATLNRREETLKTRHEILQRLRNEMEGYHEGVRAVLQARKEKRGQSSLAGIIGTLSQIIQVPPDLEGALEVALGGRLQDVVVQTFGDAEAAITYLKKNRLGRATFLPLDTIRYGRAVEVPTTSGVIGLASKLVQVEASLQPVVDAALNRVVVVEDLPAARRAFEVMAKADDGSFQIVSRDGELMRSGGAVTGGRMADRKGSAGTFLSREREWRELPQQLREVTAQAQAIFEQMGENHQQLTALEQAMQQLNERRRQAKQQQQDLKTTADKVTQSAEKLAHNISWQRQLQTKTANELNHLARRENELHQEISRLEQAQQVLEREIGRLATEATALATNDLIIEVNQAKTGMVAIRERQQKQQLMVANYQAIAQQLSRQLESKQARGQALAHEQEVLRKQQAELQQQASILAEQLSSYEVKISSFEQKLAELATIQTTKEKNEQNERQQLQQYDVILRQNAIESTRSQDELTNLARQIEDDLGTEFKFEQTSEVSKTSEVSAPPSGLKQEIKQLKTQCHNLGNINPDAPREYAELSERHKFLAGQLNDLQTAITNLKQIISKLETTMHESFMETFQQVAGEFTNYFSLLFGGGEAKISLVDPDDLTNSGVEIVARPPGKRLQSLALLSGGERSLTAQALIFALLKTSPTPFVIFDEVDAMLDEANVGRFRDALVGLSQEIQFIVITHNRKTVEAASTIYGVSIGNDSVSRVYSLKLEDFEITGSN